MIWIPTARNDWRLDAVSILAILGESNIKINAHLITASWTCFLPRLMPAPQGLLAEERSEQLPYESDCHVTGIKSGNNRNGLNYFANIIHGSGDTAYSVQKFELTFKPKPNGEKGFSENSVNIRPYRWAALNLISLTSSLISLALMIWSIIIHDGVALIGILIMSFATPILCLGGKWSCEDTSQSNMSTDAPDGDVVIRARNGAFVIVKCSELLSRALYFAPNDRKFLIDLWTGRATGGVVGGLTLIVAIVLFGNCTWTMQAALAVVYTILNVAYWSATLVKPSYNWDLSQIEVNMVRETKHHAHFTDAVWTAICWAGSAEWVEANGALPATSIWREWLSRADEEARKGNSKWDARATLGQKLREASEPRGSDGLGPTITVNGNLARAENAPAG